MVSDAVTHLKRKFLRQEKITTALNYLRKNRHRMHYARAEACRLLARQSSRRRARRSSRNRSSSGMRWGARRTQAILTMCGWGQSNRGATWARVAATYHTEVQVLANVVDLSPIFAHSRTRGSARERHFRNVLTRTVRGIRLHAGDRRCSMRASLLSAVAFCACAGGESPPSVPDPSGVAMLEQRGEVLSIAFTSSDQSARLPEVLNGTAPQDFHWVLLTIPANASRGTSPIDLAIAHDDISFAQVYRDVCNPAVDNFSPCWLLERYVAGQDGLSGQIDVDIGDTTVTGRYDVTWEGITTRFGDPPQYHKHGTIGGFFATLAPGSIP